jgi:Transposase DDE domain.
MSSLQQYSLNFNKSISYNFQGGNLSSDSGLLIIRSFVEKLEIKPLLEDIFKDYSYKKHSFSSIAEQLIYTTIAGYRHDDDSDSLRNDPVFTNVLGKNSLASQPTISRFINSLDEKAIASLNKLLQNIFEKGNDLNTTNNIVLDIDSTNFETHGKQEGSSYNYHYGEKGYHPLMLFNGLNGDLIKTELREGSVYTSKNAKDFLEPVFKWLTEKYPSATIVLRGDSGFASSEIYDLCHKYNVEILIKLKSNAILKKLSDYVVSEFMNEFGLDYSKYHVMYDEFDYKADSWSNPLRVICKVERDSGQLLPRVNFIATTFNSEPKNVVRAYNKRGNMENFIKEAKLDFFMNTSSHSSFTANAAKMLIKALAYNIINIMKRAVFPVDMHKSRLSSIRTSIIKIACRCVKTGRKIHFKLCSSSPYQNQFNTIIKNIECFRPNN